MRNKKGQFIKGAKPENRGRGVFQKGHKGFLNHPNQTSFKKGVIPWSKKVKGLGILKSNSGSFKKGDIPWMKGKTGKLSPLWKGGISFEPYSVDWTDTLKKSIRERDHYVCQVCSKNGWVVHHIDYDKKNCNPDNLITLCSSCHMKTNFNREYWINYFYGKI